MVSFEPSLSSESDGIITLKNNTKEQIHTICFNLYFFDEEGKECNANFYTRLVKIHPGKTEMLDLIKYKHNIVIVDTLLGVPSYQVPEEKHCYDSVVFKLIDYNMKTLRPDLDSEYLYTMNDDGTVRKRQFRCGTADALGWFVVIALGIFVFVLISLMLLVANLAKDKNRNVLLWLLISLLLTPIICIIILMLIPKKNSLPQQ